MKYFFGIILGLFMMGQTELNAQYYDQTIGLRVGTSVEASYKRFIFYTPKIQQAIEFLGGFQVDEGIFFPGVVYDQPLNNGYVFETLWVFHLDLGFDTNFSGFAGAGGYLGAYTETGKTAFFGGGFTAVVGVEYTFSHAPVSVSVDWKPIIGFPRLSLARGSLTLRYVLPTTWQ
ncbi:hypothetical protein [Aureispira anguillae]|uniref:Uncharacterized protein n=1 Tax=Aureispira anguillae TaxID=2864201 RepID=A0A915YKA7_9BACT|nr:hypothetical protein [Aureispira anguillae]BDS14506.1 hypothetical protein AsAng_0052860 [Aureispira anguillae]